MDFLRRLVPGLYRQADTPPKYHSRFGGFWTDRLDAERVISTNVPPGTARYWKEKLEFFIKNGYVVLEGAVPVQAVDAYISAFDAAKAGQTPILASVQAQPPLYKSVVPLNEADLSAQESKVLDTYYHLPSAHGVIFSEKITAFLRLVFANDILAFQGLHFDYGSRQAIHQDSAFVVVDEPMKFCASWVALEDIRKGSGELIYYRGSHRLEDWLYSGEHKHYNHERDPHQELLDHLAGLHTRSRDRGFQLDSFLAKKGDALIWAADLAHGGSDVVDPAMTRRSLVTHYTTQANAPHYFQYLPEERRVRRDAKPGCAYTTFYY